MITSMMYDHEARKRSYALMADAFGLDSAVPEKRIASVG
jgi:hypothetical protein